MSLPRSRAPGFAFSHTPTPSPQQQTLTPHQQHQQPQQQPDEALLNTISTLSQDVERMQGMLADLRSQVVQNTPPSNMIYPPSSSSSAPPVLHSSPVPQYTNQQQHEPTPEMTALEAMGLDVTSLSIPMLDLPQTTQQQQQQEQQQQQQQLDAAYADFSQLVMTSGPEPDEVVFHHVGYQPHQQQHGLHPASNNGNPNTQQQQQHINRSPLLQFADQLTNSPHPNPAHHSPHMILLPSSHYTTQQQQQDSTNLQPTPYFLPPAVVTPATEYTPGSEYTLGAYTPHAHAAVAADGYGGYFDLPVGEFVSQHGYGGKYAMPSSSPQYYQVGNANPNANTNTQQPFGYGMVGDLFAQPHQQNQVVLTSHGTPTNTAHHHQHQQHGQQGGQQQQQQQQQQYPLTLPYLGSDSGSDSEACCSINSSTTTTTAEATRSRSASLESAAVVSVVGGVGGLSLQQGGVNQHQGGNAEKQLLLYACPQEGCVKKLKSLQALRSHLVSHKPPTLKCRACPIAFRRKSDLYRHERTLHATSFPSHPSSTTATQNPNHPSSSSTHATPSTPTTHECPRCFRPFLRADNLRRHLRKTCGVSPANVAAARAAAGRVNGAGSGSPAGSPAASPAGSR